MATKPRSWFRLRLSTACVGSLGKRLTAPAKAQGKKPLTRTFEFQGITREYFVSLPKDFNLDKAYWLLVVVHGGRGQLRTNTKVITVRRAAEYLKLPSIVISPKFNTVDKQVGRFPAATGQSHDGTSARVRGRSRSV